VVAAVGAHPRVRPDIAWKPVGAHSRVRPGIIVNNQGRHMGLPLQMK